LVCHGDPGHLLEECGNPNIRGFWEVRYVLFVTGRPWNVAKAQAIADIEISESFVLQYYYSAVIENLEHEINPMAASHDLQ